jgi:hypothetical protein
MPPVEMNSIMTEEGEECQGNEPFHYHHCKLEKEFKDWKS